MIIYLLKTIACSAAFYALYYFIFQKEKMLVFNRFYLLGSLVASFIIPLITFTVTVPKIQQPLVPVDYSAYELNTVPAQISNYNGYDYATMAAIVIFAIVSAVLLIRFFINLLKIQKSIRNGEYIPFEQAKIILINEPVIPHSFLNNIFINDDAYKTGKIEEGILIHELAHIKQKHSWDIIFIELLQIVCWFNPMLYLYKRAIKTNHEFLADEAVVQQTADRLHYQQLLLQSVYVNNNIPLASSFFSTTKKRLIMLQKTFKQKRAVWAGIAVVPLLALLVYFLSTKVYAQKAIPTSLVVLNETNKESNGLPENIFGLKVTGDENKNFISAEIKFKDGKVINEEISTKEKQKIFEEKFNLKLPLSSSLLPSNDRDIIAEEVSSIDRIISGKNLNNDTVPPPPPYSKAAQDKFNEWPVIFQFTDTKNSITKVIQVAESKAIKRPTGVKNMVVTIVDGYVKNAIMIYDNGNSIVEDISTNEGRDNFKRNYGMEMGYKVYEETQLKIKDKKSFKPPLIVNDKTGEKGVSKEEMKEYEAIMKEMAVKKNGRTEYKFIDGKTQIATEIYKRMSVAQRKKATPFPPPLPPPPPPPGNLEKTKKDVVTVSNKNGKKIAKLVTKNGVFIEDISTSAKEKAFEKKYGVTIPPPPPPPPRPTAKGNFN